MSAYTDADERNDNSGRTWPTNPPTPTMDRLAEIISDAEVIQVHGHANFGTMTPREVVNDGVRKVAVGFHTGHTQFCILREHGLITKPRAGTYDVNLTEKGKRYARALWPWIEEARSVGGDVVELREALERISAAAPDVPKTGHPRTYKGGFDAALMWAADVARAALSRIEAGGGSLPAQGPSVPTEQADRAVLTGHDRHLVEVPFPNGMSLTIVREDEYDAVTIWSEDGESIFTQAEVAR